VYRPGEGKGMDAVLLLQFSRNAVRVILDRLKQAYCLSSFTKIIQENIQYLILDLFPPEKNLISR
jgi:hypothetical protein